MPARMFEYAYIDSCSIPGNCRHFVYHETPYLYNALCVILIIVQEIVMVKEVYETKYAVIRW